MSARSSLRLALAFSFTVPACAAFSQAVPAIPPASDPSFWGKKNTPYTLKLTYADGSSTPPMKDVVSDVSLDSAGRVLRESFYTNGQPMAVSIEDPIENTNTFMYLAEKKSHRAPTRAAHHTTAR